MFSEILLVDEWIEMFSMISIKPRFSEKAPLQYL
jgi:hypothetical protein